MHSMFQNMTGWNRTKEETERYMRWVDEIFNGIFQLPYRSLLRRPKFNAGPINVGPNNASFKG